MKKNENEYIMKLENMIDGLLEEINSLSENYRFDIDDGDSNYNYYKHEFKRIYRDFRKELNNE